MSNDLTPEDAIRGRALILAREQPELVAVAPELLEVLERLAWIAADDKTTPVGVLRQASTVIAKAKGRSEMRRYQEGIEMSDAALVRRVLEGNWEHQGEIGQALAALARIEQEIERLREDVRLYAVDLGNANAEVEQLRARRQQVFRFGEGGGKTWRETQLEVELDRLKGQLAEAEERVERLRTALQAKPRNE